MKMGIGNGENRLSLRSAAMQFGAKMMSE